MNFGLDQWALILAMCAIASIVLVLLRYRTVFFGFAFFGFFNIASASLSAFLFSYAASLPGYWITTAHLWVVIYTSLGLIAFSLGVAFAWLPLQCSQFDHSTIFQKQSRLTRAITYNADLPSWMHSRLPLVLLAFSTVVYILTPFFYSFATIQVVWSTFYEVLPLSLLTALIYAFRQRDFSSLKICLVVYILLVLYGMVTSGHAGDGGTFVVQLLLVSCFFERVRWRGAIVFLLAFMLSSSQLVGWMQSRDLIREGQLTGETVIDRAFEFTQRFNYINPLTLSPQDVDGVLRLRIDMSDILAAQVRQQPAIEPFAYGGTVVNNLPIAIVPRFLWPDKPTLVGGSDFVSRYSGIKWGDHVSVGVPYPFELYANGGAIGVVIGLFLVGWLTARCELAAFDSRRPLHITVVFMFLASAIATGEQTIVALIMKLMAGVPAYYMLGLYLEYLDRKGWLGERVNTMTNVDTVLSPVHCTSQDQRLLIFEDPTQTKVGS